MARYDQRSGDLEPNTSLCTGCDDAYDLEDVGCDPDDACPQCGCAMMGAFRSFEPQGYDDDEDYAETLGYVYPIQN